MAQYETTHEKTTKTLMIVIIVLLLIGVLGIFYLILTQKNNAAPVTSTTTQSTPVAATPTTSSDNTASTTTTDSTQSATSDQNASDAAMPDAQGGSADFRAQVDTYLKGQQVSNGLTNPNLTVKFTDDFAIGSYFVQGGGGWHFLLAKGDGKVNVVYANQDDPQCDSLIKAKVPASVYVGNCYMNNNVNSSVQYKGL